MASSVGNRAGGAIYLGSSPITKITILGWTNTITFTGTVYLYGIAA
jgi:hypothetical protein